MSAVGMPGYQESAAGWIPADWSPLPLGAVASVRKDKGVAKQGVPCVELEHVEPETGRLLGWDSSGTQASIKTAFKRGDVLFGKLRPYLRKYAVAPFDGICTTEILAIHPRDGQSDSQFLFHLMQGDGVFATVEALSYGTKMPRVSWTDLSDIVLGIPPLPEQQKIAAILTAVDDKLDVIARQIEATQTLKQGLMQTLFSRGVGTQDADGRWVPHTEFKDSELGAIPADWMASTIGNVGDLKNGINKPKEAFGKGHQFVNLMDVFGKSSVANSDFGLVETSAKERKEFSLRRGDILFVRSSVKPSGVGLTSLIEEDIPEAVYSGFLIRFRLTDSALFPSFLKHYFLSDSFRALLLKKSTVSANTNINQVALMSLPVIFPSAAEQSYITSLLDALDAKSELLTQKQSHFQTLKRGLMQKLLTGEWRVSLDVSATGT